ncbi:MAG: hypothetical protein LBU90_09475 [Bacteroidales bacterium]|jgi:glycosyltransferase involved in cell wall biosynthesis|nr:hypothetical protein [Bacteroidales bacterium]
MKQVLILCDAFPPDFAPRMGYLCNYLPALGWEPFVITEKQHQHIFPEMIERQNIVSIDFYPAKQTCVKKLQWFCTLIADFLWNYKDRKMEKAARKIMKTRHFSLVLASSYRTFPLRAARQISQKNHIPLLIDLRDIVEQYAENEYIAHTLRFSFLKKIAIPIFTKKLLRERNKALHVAAAVTTVSEWHKEFLLQFNSYTHLIYNGFDADLFVPKKVRTEQFRIVYTGRILSLHMRNPELLCAAVAQLHSEHCIDAATFRIQFYTNEESKEILLQFVEKYRIASFVDFFSMRPHAQIPAILNEASILLLLSNSSKGTRAPKGIMGTKTFEYLAVEKPILCVRSDEGCLQDLIARANAGISASTVAEAAQFIMEQYAEWQKNGYTHQAVNRELLQQFSRKGQALQFADIFEELSV